MAAVEDNSIMGSGPESAPPASVTDKPPKRLTRKRKSGDFGPAPKILEYLLLALVALASARLFWLIFAPLPIADTPAPVIRPTVSDNNTVEARSPFTPMAETVEAAAVAAAAPEEVQETALDLKLHGAFSEGDDSSAIISTPQGKQKAFRIGDEITNGVTLKEVFLNYVIINSNGIDESLKLPKDVEIEATAPARAPQPVRGSASTPAASAPSGGASLLDVAQFETMLDSDGEPAVAIIATGDISKLEALGLRDRDIVRAIDNRRINELGDALPRLAGKRSVRVVVERNGTPIEVVVNLNSGKNAGQ
ncbi:MAG: type II secretion system protein N [Pseudomonadota bacterium]